MLLAASVAGVLGTGALVGFKLSGDGDVEEVGGVAVLISARLGGGMDSAGGGELEVVGGCLGASDVVVIWPHGTQVVAQEPLTIQVPGSEPVAMGELIEFSGGFVVEHSSDHVEPGSLLIAGVTVPAECAKHDIFVAWE